MVKSKLLFAFLAAGLVFGVASEEARAEAGIAGFNTSCAKDFRHWKRQGGWKAYVVSNIYLVGKVEWQSCGSSWQYSTKANAVTVAFGECRRQLRIKHAPKSARCSLRRTSR